MVQPHVQEGESLRRNDLNSEYNLSVNSPVVSSTNPSAADTLINNMEPKADQPTKDWKSKILFYIKSYGVEIIGLILFIMGVIFLSKLKIFKNLPTGICYEECTDYIDYTNCQHLTNQQITCPEYRVISDAPCDCKATVNFTNRHLENITLYYELDNFDQEEPSYSASRDDHQLAGNLTGVPSENCGNYRYNSDNKPIAPCGQVADSIFTDDYELQRPTTSDCDKLKVEVVHDGMIKEEYKKNYRNPSDELWLNYVRPNSWTEHTETLITDTANPNNNKFQNERFIGWMTTSMKRKPVFRVDGYLKPGPYNILIHYNHSPITYNGTRKLIFCGQYCRGLPQENKMTGVVLLLLLIYVGLTLFLARPILRCIRIFKTLDFMTK